MNWVLFFIVTVIVVAATVGAVVVLYQLEEPQVFLYYDTTNPISTLEEAQNMAVKFGGVPATPQQVQASYEAGAAWCVAGFASDGNTYFPAQTKTAGCGNKGINKGTCKQYGNKCGVLIYGKKPSSGTAGVTPFNGSAVWSQWKWYDPMH